MSFYDYTFGLCIPHHLWTGSLNYLTQLFLKLISKIASLSCKQALRSFGLELEAGRSGGNTAAWLQQVEDMNSNRK